jgi:hypothetical protein
MDLPRPAKTLKPRQAVVLAAKTPALTNAAVYERLAAWRAARAQKVLDATLPE